MASQSGVVDLTLEDTPPPPPPPVLPPPPPLPTRSVPPNPRTIAYIVIDSDDEDGPPSDALSGAAETPRVKKEVEGDLRDLLPTVFNAMMRDIRAEQGTKRGKRPKLDAGSARDAVPGSASNAPEREIIGPSASAGDTVSGSPSTRPERGDIGPSHEPAASSVLGLSTHAIVKDHLKAETECDSTAERGLPAGQSTMRSLVDDSARECHQSGDQSDTPRATLRVAGTECNSLAFEPLLVPETAVESDVRDLEGVGCHSGKQIDTLIPMTAAGAETGAGLIVQDRQEDEVELEADMMEVDEQDGEGSPPVVPSRMWDNIFRLSANDAFRWGKEVTSPRAGMSTTVVATPPIAPASIRSMRDEHAPSIAVNADPFPTEAPSRDSTGFTSLTTSSSAQIPSFPLLENPTIQSSSKRISVSPTRPANRHLTRHLEVAPGQADPQDCGDMLKHTFGNNGATSPGTGLPATIVATPAAASTPLKAPRHDNAPSPIVNTSSSPVPLSSCVVNERPAAPSEAPSTPLTSISTPTSAQSPGFPILTNPSILSSSKRARSSSVSPTRPAKRRSTRPRGIAAPHAYPQEQQGIVKPAFINSLASLPTSGSMVTHREEITEAEVKDFVVFLAVNWDLNERNIAGWCRQYQRYITAGLHDTEYLRKHYMVHYRDYRGRVLKLKRDAGPYLKYGQAALPRCTGCKGTSPALSAVPGATGEMMYCKNCLVASVKLQGIKGGMAGYLVERRKIVRGFELEVLGMLAR